MATSSKDVQKLRLAENLIQQAEHSSELEMRSSISRAYYALYHAAGVAIGRSLKSHGQYRSALNERVSGLGDDFNRLRDLRTKADYNPDFVSVEFGDVDKFRAAFLGIIEDYRRVYERLLRLVEESDVTERA